MSPASTEQFLLEQYIGHPASQLQDLRKALYQSVFGCGHLITDTSAAAEGIRREAAEAGPCSRGIEALDGPWSRVHLGVLADGLTPETPRVPASGSAQSPLPKRLWLRTPDHGYLCRRRRYPEGGRGSRTVQPGD